VVVFTVFLVESESLEFFGSQLPSLIFIEVLMLTKFSFVNIQGKHLTTYLTKASHSMLPVTPLVKPDTRQFQPFHENTQGMPSHPFSHKQAFIPVSESREYTRSDAGEEFGLPPTEEAVPHPESILTQKRRLGLIMITIWPICGMNLTVWRW
jgi:hypothetical protein